LLLHCYHVQATVSHMEVNGALVVRNFLTGSPQFKMVLNEDLVIVDTSHKGMSVIKYESKTYSFYCTAVPIQCLL